MAIIWKGGWLGSLDTSDITYYRDEIVSYNNITYIATAPSIPIGSPAPPQDMGNWDIVVNGATGTSGTSGLSGINGTSGTTGTSGTSGVSGVNGTSGTSGTVGTSGTSGVSPLGNSKVFTAGTAGTSWTFTHNLGVTRPFVQVWSTSGMVIIPQEIISVDSNNIKIDFPEPVAGTAIIGNGYSGTSGTSGSGTSGTSGTSPLGQGVYYTRGTAGTSWTISHNLNTPIPLVQVYDSSNKMILPQDIILTDDNTTTITFAAARTGRAIITNGNASSSGTSGILGTNGTSGTSGFGVPTGGTSGQFLIKNSSTSGDTRWYTLPSNAKQYIGTNRNMDQTGVGLQSVIIMNTISTPTTAIPYDTNTGIYTLTAGKVYQLTAHLAWGSFSDTTSGFLTYGWMDSTNTILSTTAMGVVYPDTRSPNQTSQPVAYGIFAPSNTAYVKLRVVANTGTATLSYSFSYVSIIEI